VGGGEAKKPERKNDRKKMRKRAGKVTNWPDLAKQCCGSGMFLPNPDFYPSRIPNQTTATKEDGERNLLTYPFVCSQKYHKIVNYFILEQVKKKI
jgi:hypothetical protein